MGVGLSTDQWLWSLDSGHGFLVVRDRGVVPWLVVMLDFELTGSFSACDGG